MISSLLHLVGLRPQVYYTLTNFSHILKNMLQLMRYYQFLHKNSIGHLLRTSRDYFCPSPPLNTPMSPNGVIIEYYTILQIENKQLRISTFCFNVSLHICLHVYNVLCLLKSICTLETRNKH